MKNKFIATKLHAACERTRAEQRLRDSAPDLLAERDALRLTVDGLAAQLNNICDRAEEWRATSGFVEIEALAIKHARALAERATQRGKS